MIEIYGEEVQQNAAIEQGMFTPILTTSDYNLKGQVLFLIFYKQHVAESMLCHAMPGQDEVTPNGIQFISQKSSLRGRDQVLIHSPLISLPYWYQICAEQILTRSAKSRRSSR